MSWAEASRSETLSLLPEDTLRRAAEALDAAERSGEPVPQPSVLYPAMGVADAYRIQRSWAELKRGRGARQLGYKIGLTTPAMQAGMKTGEPAYGCLMDDFQYANGAHIPAGRFITPKVELELAFILGRRLAGPGISIQEALEATAWVRPAFELCAFRTLLPRVLTDTVADNCASSGLVLGGRPTPPQKVDLRWVGGILSKNGQIEETGLAALVMGDPAASLAWLAGKLHEHGRALEPGDIVLSGTFTRPMPVEAGDVVHADCGPLGAVEATFV